MTIDLQQNRIALLGDCPIEEAETLLNLLDSSPDIDVDLTRAGHLHAAVFQALLARRLTPIGPAADQFVERWLRPLLSGGSNV